MPAPREVATSPAAQRSSQKEVTTPFGLGQIAATGRAQAAPASSSPISKRTIALVQQSWAQVMPISDAASSLFYARLFTLDPSLRAMFKSDMTEQKKKLMQTLSVAVDGLSNLPKLVPALQALGERHAGYMVVDEHYDLVGDALLWTLREGLGDSFTGEIEAAWKEVYAVVADTMKKAVAAGAEATGAAARAAAPAAAAKPAAPAQAAVKPVSPTMPAPAARPAAPAAKAAEAAPGSPISKRTIALVQQSWAQVMPISDAAASLFYDRLFTLDPSLRAMFKSDMAEQTKKLMQTLSVAVDGLSNLPKLVPVLQALGERHAGYMVLDEHYDLVGEALLWTLHEGLGDAFNAEVEAAWKEVYGVVAGTMKKAAAAAGGPRAPAPAAKAAEAAPGSPISKRTIALV
ncbi:MAG: hemoglobin, partial [Polyangiaceae bacterium]|nr:hemoglobin [Polyangiaceae bacterium]